MESYALYISVILAIAFLALAIFFVILWQRALSRESEANRHCFELQSESTRRKEAETERDEARRSDQQAQIKSSEASARADAADKLAHTLREDVAELNTQKTQNTTLIAEQKEKLKGADEKIAAFKEMRDAMSNEFRNLAQNVLEEKSETFDKNSQKVLDPLHKELEGFRKRVDEIYTEGVKMNTSLKKEVEILHKNAVDVSDNANNLARALKGDSKIQGDWGEVELAALLEQSGLREGEGYEPQKSMRDEEGNSLRPDVVVNLPNERHFIIDSKVSLRAYTDSVGAENDDERKLYLKEHVKAIQSHVKKLSDKNYHGLKGVNSPDFVFMFMAVEPAFYVALMTEPALFNDAYQKNVVLCSPTTLMPVLRSTEHIWKLDKQNRHAEEIAKQGGKLYDKFSGFIDSMTDIDKALISARKQYNVAYNRLATGKDNLITQANKMRDMGIRTQKPKLEMKNPEDNPD